MILFLQDFFPSSFFLFSCIFSFPTVMDIYYSKYKINTLFLTNITFNLLVCVLNFFLKLWSQELGMVTFYTVYYSGSNQETETTQ